MGSKEEELERVVYRGSDNHIHCLWWQDRGSQRTGSAS